MKFPKKLFAITIMTSVLLLQYNGILFADDLLSPTYKMLDPTVNSSDNIGSSSTYTARVSVGDFGTNPQLTSASYKLNGNQINEFNANVPKISCLENSTDGSSACTTASSFINTGGMIRACGSPGCYDRARLEISPESNPVDTLYAIQISTDPSFGTFMYISGTTNQPISADTRTITDYKTKTDWESIDLNIQGLNPNTPYYFRVTALHGDLSESSPSPIVPLTTSQIALSQDLIFADINETIMPTPENNINFQLPAGLVTKAGTLIWINSNSNVFPGISVYTKGTHGGLFDGAIVEIPSASVDLTTELAGFGLQLYQSSQWYDSGDTGGHGQGSLGVLTAENAYIQDYNGATENIGIIPQEPTLEKVLSTTAPVYHGKAGLYIVAKAALGTLYRTSISENITIVTTANY
jgi:hypothetical protein